MGRFSESDVRKTVTPLGEQLLRGELLGAALGMTKGRVDDLAQGLFQEEIRNEEGL